MKVLLGIPCGGTIKAKTMLSVIGALANAPCELGLQILEGSLGPENRVLLALEAVDAGYTHLWLVDADQTFPADTLSKLLAHDKDIVGAAYNYRGLPLRTTVKIQDEHETVGTPSGPLPTALFQCYAVGFGCALFKTAALRRVPQPWFALGFDASGRMDASEDVWLCRQARSVGIETWCDPTIECGHIGEHIY